MRCKQSGCGVPGVGRVYSSLMLEQKLGADGTLPSEICPRCKGTGREPLPEFVLLGLPLTMWFFGVMPGSQENGFE